MGLGTMLKANKALKMQRDGKKEEALRLYEEAIAGGLNEARYLLPYSLLLVRDGQYQKAKEFLVKHQKMPMTQDQRIDLYVYYAVCCLRLGQVDKGIDVLEQQFRKTETGLLYQTLGYLYVEKYDMKNQPDFPAALPAEKPSEEPAEQPAEEPAAQTGDEPAEGDAAEKEPELTPEEAWNAGKEKGEAFIRKSVEYDDEDSVCLDNLAQWLYRVRGDKAGAKEWFEKAIAQKDGQIDTLYFLSRYDEEAGNRQAALEKLEKAAEGRFSPLNYCTRETVDSEIARLKGDA